MARAAAQVGLWQVPHRRIHPRFAGEPRSPQQNVNLFSVRF
jgi:hypothetical protein